MSFRDHFLSRVQIPTQDLTAEVLAKGKGRPFFNEWSCPLTFSSVSELLNIWHSSGTCSKRWVERLFLGPLKIVVVLLVSLNHKQREHSASKTPQGRKDSPVDSPRCIARASLLRRCAGRCVSSQKCSDRRTAGGRQRFPSWALGAKAAENNMLP